MSTVCTFNFTLFLLLNRISVKCIPIKCQQVGTNWYSVVNVSEQILLEANAHNPIYREIVRNSKNIPSWAFLVEIHVQGLHHLCSWFCCIFNFLSRRLDLSPIKYCFIFLLFQQIIVYLFSMSTSNQKLCQNECLLNFLNHTLKKTPTIFKVIFQNRNSKSKVQLEDMGCTLVIHSIPNFKKLQ